MPCKVARALNRIPINKMTQKLTLSLTWPPYQILYPVHMNQRCFCSVFLGFIWKTKHYCLLNLVFEQKQNSDTKIYAQVNQIIILNVLSFLNGVSDKTTV
jgi:hypothetical protein